jgi:magnesium-transporting ATPase (P-type)
MFAALNSLSSRQSILSRHGNPFNNFYLIGAISLSFSLHFVILYVPLLAKIFQIVPITFYEWQYVLLISAPVILLEEIIKFVDRNFGVHHVKVQRGKDKVKRD